MLVDKDINKNMCPNPEKTITLEEIFDPEWPENFVNQEDIVSDNDEEVPELENYELFGMYVFFSEQ